jgi:hypothetical protein
MKVRDGDAASIGLTAAASIHGLVRYLVEPTAPLAVLRRGLARRLSRQGPEKGWP